VDGYAAGGVFPTFVAMPINSYATTWALRACVLALFIPAPVSAQDSALPNRPRSIPVQIARITSDIVLDGVVDEAAWDAITPLPMTMYAPVAGGELTERTEVRVGHDDEFLYVSGRLYDSDPDGPRTNTLYRDNYSGDDLLALVVDSYNDYETAVWFITNPAGVRNDRSISNDAQFTGGIPMNSDWNAHWDVATTQTDEGWFVEYRIPFSTLGFQVVDGQVTMGLTTYRYIARKNERHIYPAIEPIWGRIGFAKPSLSQRIQLRDVLQSKPVYVTPFWLGGLTQRPVLSSPPDVPSTRWRTDDDPLREMGLDLRFSPSSNLAVDLTVNTDFAQVEADNQQVNLTRFALFFPEKRQFFQERSSTFQFSTGGFTDRLFHSRQIGLANGQIVRIYGGVRAVGQIGRTDFGFLSMQTAASETRAAENMGVLRLNQQVLNPYSSVGAMMTTRLGSGGKDNITYGVDTFLRLVGDDYAIVKWAQSFDEVIEEGSALDAGLFLARWERRKDEGFVYSGEFRRVGKDYRPGLGFQIRRDFFYYGGRGQYRHFLDDSSPALSAAFIVGGANYLRLDDRSAESRSVMPEVNVEFRNGIVITAGATSTYESLDRDFGIAGVTVPVGNYWFHEGRARVEFPRSWMTRGNYDITAGTFYDGSRVSLKMTPTWTVSKNLELTGGYEINRISFAERDQATTVHLGSVKVALALDAKLQFSAFAQYSNDSDLTSMNLRFRYHFREGTDLWIVWNEGLYMDRANGLDPRLPLSAGRQIMVKYSHALIW
jgi:uncharacterized protein DUF5916/cellulose/xylan binding protein with CBM9 domain